MDKMIVLLYDLGAILIILMTVAHCARKGFATGIIRAVGEVAAFFGALILSRGSADFVYQNLIREDIMVFLRDRPFFYSEQPIELLSQLEQAVTNMPDTIRNVLNLGIGICKRDLTQLNIDPNSILDSLEKSIIAPTAKMFISVILFIVIFAVLGLVVGLLTSAADFAFHSPILKPIDQFLGGAIMGTLQSAINLYLICIAFKLFFVIFGEMEYFSQEIVLNTQILSKIYMFNPLTLLSLWK